jgi:hypothetical protein
VTSAPGILSGTRRSGHLPVCRSTICSPRRLLYEHGYSRGQVNSVANYCFLTQKTNLAIGRRSPQEYFPEVADKHPGALESQWVPMDRKLWHPGRYLDFLAVRQELLAQAANEFLSALRSGEGAARATPLERLGNVARLPLC